MEEYVPHLIKHRVYCVIIVRDPRDVISSLDYGRGMTYTGDHRPVLFNLRNWRKSVYFALAAVKAANFYQIRFEDLVFQPKKTLDTVARMLSLPLFHEKYWANGLQNANGTVWRGNSSFGSLMPFHSGAVGGFKKNLPETTRRYIEAVCRREMLAMGYAVSPSSLRGCKRTIAEFKEPFKIGRPEFSSGYSGLSENVKTEIKHLENPDKNSFLFESAADTILGVNPWM